MSERYCPRCSAPVHGSARKRYCSERCRKRAELKRYEQRRSLRREPRHPTPCAWCSEPTTRKWCSQRCKDCGQGRVYYTVRPSACVTCLTPIEQPRKPRFYCSSGCNPNQTTKRNDRTARLNRAEILERDGWRCGICGLAISRTVRWPDPRSAVIDHIVPLARGGSDEMANLQAAHEACNRAKGCGTGPRGDQLRLVG